MNQEKNTNPFSQLLEALDAVEVDCNKYNTSMYPEIYY